MVVVNVLPDGTEVHEVSVLAPDGTRVTFRGTKESVEASLAKFNANPPKVPQNAQPVYHGQRLDQELEKAKKAEELRESKNYWESTVTVEGMSSPVKFRGKTELEAYQKAEEYRHSLESQNERQLNAPPTEITYYGQRAVMEGAEPSAGEIFTEISYGSAPWEKTRVKGEVPEVVLDDKYIPSALKPTVQELSFTEKAYQSFAEKFPNYSKDLDTFMVSNFGYTSKYKERMGVSSLATGEMVAPSMLLESGKGIMEFTSRGAWAVGGYSAIHPIQAGKALASYGIKNPEIPAGIVLTAIPGTQPIGLALLGYGAIKGGINLGSIENPRERYQAVGSTIAQVGTLYAIGEGVKTGYNAIRARTNVEVGKVVLGKSQLADGSTDVSSVLKAKVETKIGKETYTSETNAITAENVRPGTLSVTAMSRLRGFIKPVTARITRLFPGSASVGKTLGITRGAGGSTLDFTTHSQVSAGRVSVSEVTAMKGNQGFLAIDTGQEIAMSGMGKPGVLTRFELFFKNPKISGKGFIFDATSGVGGGINPSGGTGTELITTSSGGTIPSSVSKFVSSSRSSAIRLATASAPGVSFAVPTIAQASGGGSLKTFTASLTSRVSRGMAVTKAVTATRGGIATVTGLRTERAVTQRGGTSTLLRTAQAPGLATVMKSATGLSQVSLVRTSQVTSQTQRSLQRAVATTGTGTITGMGFVPAIGIPRVPGGGGGFPPFSLPGGGGWGSATPKIKGFTASRSYVPNVIGLASGRTRSSSPDIVSGLGVRLPVKRRKKRSHKRR